MHLQQLGRLDFVEPEPPAVDVAQVDLLEILVVAIRREQRVVGAIILVEIAALARNRAGHEAFGLARNGLRARERSSFLRRAEHAAEFAVLGQHGSPLGGQRRERRGFGLEQVREDSGGPPHGLARVVEDVVEPRQPLAQESRE
jgi:hypothetical protein